MDYWLALWWGSARWIAHIWVLKYLKEKKYKYHWNFLNKYVSFDLRIVCDVKRLWRNWKYFKNYRF